MAKLQSVWIPLGVLFLIVAVVGALYFTGVMPQASVSSSCTGGQVLSVNDVYITDSPELGKKVVRVLFSTLQTSECLNIYVDPITIENELKERGRTDFDAQKPIRGDIVMRKQQKVYSVRETGNTFKRIGLADIDSGFTGAVCTQSKCAKQGYPTTFASVIEFQGINPHCICAFDDVRGNAAEYLSSTQLEWTVNVNIGDQSTTLTQSKLSDRVGNIAFVKWAANLVSNDNLQSINRGAYKPYSTNQFRMVDSNAYSSLQASYDSARLDLIACDRLLESGLVPQCRDEVRAARAYQATFDTKTRDDQLLDFVLAEPLVTGAHFSSNKLFLDLKSPIAYPQFTVDIDAAQVGIFISKGKPQAQCPANFNDLVSGQTKTVKFTVKNVGQNSGAFSYDLSCNKGSQVLSPSPPRAIAANSLLSVDATLGLTVSQGTETSSCTFTVTELNSLEQSSCGFSYTATKQSQCIANTLSCEAGGSELWKCLPDGNYERTQCTFGCEAFEGSFRCRLTAKENCADGIDNNGDGLIDKDDPQCKDKSDSECGAWLEIGSKTIVPNFACIINNFVEKFRWVFAIVVGLLSALIGGLIYHRIASITQLSSAIWIPLVVGLVLGLALGYLAFIYFWVSMLALLIFLIIKIII